MLISIETHITYDFPGGGESGPPTPLWIRTWGDCACAHAHFEPSLLANATSTRMSLVSRDACNEQMINCNCTHQSSSSQAKGTNSTSFLVLVPLACEDLLKTILIFGPAHEIFAVIAYICLLTSVGR